MPTTTRRRPLEERLWAKVDKHGSPFPGLGPCWLWTGAVTKAGYGRFMVEPGVVRQAHRVVYELLVGEIPDGRQLDHLCRVRRCVNPRHLEPVTARENLVRGEGWAGQARKTHCPKGHSLEDALIHHGRRECRQCNKDRCRERYHRQKNQKENT